MGACCNSDKQGQSHAGRKSQEEIQKIIAKDGFLEHKSATFQIVVNLIKARGLPNMDHAIKEQDRRPDAYAKFFLAEDQQGHKRITEIHKTLYRVNGRNPVWNSHRMFTGKHNSAAELFLIVRLYDFDKLKSDDSIGEVSIEVSEYESGKMETYPIVLKKGIKKLKDTGCTLDVQIFKEDVKWPTKKTIFFIRHGESKWNEAEQKIKNKGNVLEGVKTMASRDHPLNHIGISQALDLNKRYKKAAAEGGDEDVEKFIKAQLVLASPLTRALQTCLIGLEGHERMSTDGVRLVSTLREVKNKIGWDALGKETGDKIPERVRECLVREYENAHSGQLQDLSLEKIEKVLGPKISLNDTLEHWWDPDWDTSKEICERIYDLINYLRFSPESTIICVGHSLMFREICRAFIGGGFDGTVKARLSKRNVLRDSKKTDSKKDIEGQEKMPLSTGEFSVSDLAINLMKHKMGNAACLRANFDFAGTEVKGWKIENAKLMFGSELHIPHTKQRKSSSTEGMAAIQPMSSM